MPEVGIRELKSRASEIVRAVREERAEYVITHRGEPVAMIVPFAGPETKQSEPWPEQWLENLLEIGRQMEEENPNAGSVVEQLFRDREDSFRRLLGSEFEENDADAE